MLPKESNLYVSSDDEYIPEKTPKASVEHIKSIQFDDAKQKKKFNEFIDSKLS
jgi:hypothetical protein